MKFTERAPFVPIGERPKLSWPNGKRLAVWIVPNIEHYEADLLHGPTVATPAVEPPDVPNFTWRDYGMRVGVWRLMETMERLEVRGTVALNARVCELYPSVVSACVKLGWEFMGHGKTNSRPLSGMKADEETTLIPEVLATIERATGRRPRGWLGPGLAETDRTLDLLAEHGVQYVADFVNDDQPYPLTADAGTVYSLPYAIETNDIGAFVRRSFTPADWGTLLRDNFDVLYAESATTAKVMCIALHPWIVGQPFRAKHFEAALAYMRGHADAWFATGGEIVDAYRTAVSA